MRFRQTGRQPSMLAVVSSFRGYSGSAGTCPNGPEGTSHQRPATPSEQGKQGSSEVGAMADLQKLLFETPARVSDREILVAARLSARVKAFAGHGISEDLMDRINEAIAEEADRLIAEGVLRARPDWLAALVNGRLHVAFGSRAVQQLSRELKRMGAV
jgi:hypothetical protein